MPRSNAQNIEARGLPNLDNMLTGSDLLVAEYCWQVRELELEGANGPSPEFRLI